MVYLLRFAYFYPKETIQPNLGALRKVRVGAKSSDVICNAVN